MPSVNFAFNELFERIQETVAKLAKCNALVAIAENNGAINQTFLMELTEIGFDLERQQITEKTHKEILSILYGIRDQLSNEYMGLTKEFEKYQKNMKTF